MRERRARGYSGIGHHQFDDTPLAVGLVPLGEPCVHLDAGDRERRHYRRLLVRDVNGDGKLDLVICDESANTISVLLGNGDGTFQAHVDYTTGAGTSPESMRLGDFNGDGKLDVVTANAGTSNLSVLLNQGNGTFGAPTTFGTDSHPTSIAVGDLNGDGKQDVVTANIDTSSVSVLMGNGNGTFQTAVSYPCGSTPETVVLADLNGDGHPDIATANYVSTASVLLNKGNGTFAAHVDYATGSGPYSLAAADMNHDGAIDLVTVNHAANSVSVLYGNGDGTLQPKVDLAVGNGPFWVALGDFNHDGYGDIAVSNYGSGTVSVLLGSAYFSTKTAAKFTGQAEGTWYLHVRAVDTLGVGGPTATYTVHIDATPPVTTASGLVAGAGTSWTNAPSVTLSATDALSGVATTYYTVDGGAPQAYTASPITDLTAGSHAISYWSVDNAGNTKTAHSGYVNVDLTAPVTTASGLSTSATTGWNKTAATFTLAATDALSGVATTYYTVDGGQRQTYTTPVTISTAGSHAISYWSVDNAGNAETAHNAFVNVDLAAPATTATGLATSSTTGWTNGSKTVTLGATDALSGVATTYYTVDGGAPQTYTAAFAIATAGSHPVTYWSVDNAGNVEAAHNGFVNIDLVKPVTVATGLAGTTTSGWHTSATSFTLAATDAGNSGLATTNYTIDGGASAQYSGTPVPVSGDASHVVTYWSTDVAGNVEDAHTGYINIDTKAPTTTAATDPSGWTNGPVKVTLTAGDTGSGVGTTWYQVGSGDPKIYSGAITASDATQISYWSTDVAGNVESHHALTPQIDTIAPVTTAATDPSRWTNGSVQVTLTAADTGGSGIDTTWYKVGDGDAQVYTDPFTVSDATQISYWSTDKAGNEEAHNTLTPQIDTTAPVTTAATDPSGWTNGKVDVTLTATDAGGSGVATTYYRIGDGDSQAYTGPITASDATPITYWSTDKAGNEEAHNTLTPQIDTLAPVTTAATDPSGWTNGSVQVTLTASDKGGSGVATTYYRIGDGDAQTYSGPITATDATPITYWSTDKAGNEEAPNTLTPQIDTTPPVTTTADLAVGPDDDWQASTASDPATVTLAATDDQSGVATTTYQIDDQAPQGSNQVWYYAVDAAGNLETAHSGFVNIDTTPPVTTATGLVAVSDGGYIHGSQQVTLTAVDSGSGMTGGKAATWYTDTVGDTTPTPKPYTGTPFTVSGVGTHTITYYSVDALGNAETVQTGYVNILPDQALVTLASGLADNDHSGWLTTGSADVSLSTSGGGGTITTQYRVDDGPQWLAYTGPFSVAGDGSHRVDYRSSDNVGDGWSQSTGYVNIDTVGPATVVTAPTTPQRATVTVRFSGTDSLSGYSTTFSKVDGGKWSAGPTAVVTALASHKADGVHTISYYSMDVAGNAGPTGQVKVTIDTRRPALTLRGATKVTVRKGRFLALRYRSVDAGGACKLVLTFSRKVPGKAVKTSFTISARRVSSWQSSKLRLKLAKGAYAVKLQLRDLAGNLSAVKTMRVTVK